MFTMFHQSSDNYLMSRRQRSRQVRRLPLNFHKFFAERRGPRKRSLICKLSIRHFPPGWECQDSELRSKLIIFCQEFGWNKKTNVTNRWKNYVLLENPFCAKKCRRFDSFSISAVFPGRMWKHAEKAIDMQMTACSQPASWVERERWVGNSIKMSCFFWLMTFVNDVCTFSGISAILLLL